MTDSTPVRFTLEDGTTVTVKKVANNKYDFELRLPNDNRKTFVWFPDADEIGNNKGKVDKVVKEVIDSFVDLLNKKM